MPHTCCVYTQMNESPLDVLVYDNRGVGSSSVPHRKSAYTTNLMAADALGLMVSLHECHNCQTRKPSSAVIYRP